MRLINERIRGAGIIEIVQCCGGDQVDFITSQPRSSEAHSLLNKDRSIMFLS